jgi:hypothetical protein
MLDRCIEIKKTLRATPVVFRPLVATPVTTLRTALPCRLPPMDGSNYLDPDGYHDRPYRPAGQPRGAPG